MNDIDKKIEDYSEELFADLGLTALPEDQKADIYARLQENVHQAILDTVKPGVKLDDFAKLEEAIDQEDYRALAEVLRNYPNFQAPIEEKTKQVFADFKLIISKEQEHARSSEQSRTPETKPRAGT